MLLSGLTRAMHVGVHMRMGVVMAAINFNSHQIELTMSHAGLGDYGI